MAERGDRDRLEELYDAGSRLPAADRAAFLDRACAGDAALREELESLFAHAPEAARFFARLRPVVDALGGEEVRASPADPLVGRELGRYRIETRLGAGGMGVVYRATDAQLQRAVALKFLPAHLSLDAHARHRSLNEARVAAALDHPNLCAIHEVGETEDGVPFLVMAYCDGETLKERIARGALSVDEALDHAVQIATGLAAAHERGIIHRDVKPGNVIVTESGILKLVDFGLARLPASTLTASAATPGTVAYMAPEQLRGGPVDARADLWALGVVLYEMLCGARPFEGDSNGSIMYAVVHERPLDLAKLRPAVPLAVATIVDRLLEKEPRRRYPDARALLKDLESAGATPGRPPGRLSGLRRALRTHGPSRRHAVAAAGLAVAGLLGLSFARLLETSPTVTPSRGSLGLGVLPVRNAAAHADLDQLAPAFEERFSGELAEVAGLALAPGENLATRLGRGLPLDAIALELGVDFFVGVTLLGRGPDSLEASLRLIDGGTQVVRARSLAVAATAEGPASQLARDAAQLIRRLLGSHILERQLEVGTTSPLAAYHRRRGDQFRQGARDRLARLDVAGAEQALDSAEAALVESARLDPAWPVPRMARARLKEFRAMTILHRSGGRDFAGVRRAFADGIALLDRATGDPLALALRGRLRWQQVALGAFNGDEAVDLLRTAEADLRTALELGGDLARPAADLSELLFARGDYEGAASFAQRAWDSDVFLQETQPILHRLAMSDFERGEEDAARRRCGEGLRQFPDNPAWCACLLEILAWGAEPPDADSAWAVYGQFEQRTSPENPGSRAHYLFLVAGALARAPGVSRDSVEAVLTRARRIVEDSMPTLPSQRALMGGWEAAVRFRLGDADSARILFETLRGADSAQARLLGGRRALRGYVNGGGAAPAR